MTLHQPAPKFRILSVPVALALSGAPGTMKALAYRKAAPRKGAH